MSYSLYRYLVEFFNLLQTCAAVLITMIPCSAVQCDPQSSLLTTCWCLLVSFLKIKISSIEKEFERFS